MKRSYYLPWIGLGAVAAAGLIAMSSRSGHEPLVETAVPERVATVAAPTAHTAPVAPVMSAPSSPVERATPAAPPAARVETPKAPAANTATTPPGTAGMIVAIDPETGVLGLASPEQVQALLGGEAAVHGTTEGLVEIHRPDGTVILNLDERFHNYSVAQIGRNGKAAFGCAHNHDGALRNGSAPGMSVPVLEEE